MSTLVHYAMTSGVRNTPELQAILPSLSPVDKARATLEQCIYAHYLFVTVSNHTTLVCDYVETVRGLVAELVRCRPASGDERIIFDEIVNLIYTYPKCTYDKLHSALTMYGTFEPTIPSEFYIPWFGYLGCGVPQQTAEQGVPDDLARCYLLTPSFEVYNRPVSNAVRSNNHSGIRLVFEKVPFGGYTLDTLHTFNHGDPCDIGVWGRVDNLLGFIHQLTCSGVTIESLVGVLSSFAVEQSEYNCPTHYFRYSILDACRDYVLHFDSNTYRLRKCDHSAIGTQGFFDLIQKLVEQHRISKEQDTKIIADMIEFTHHDRNAVMDLADFFRKSYDKVTANEHHAFVVSNFKYLQTYGIVGNEAGGFDFASDQSDGGTDDLGSEDSAGLPNDSFSTDASEQPISERDPGKLLIQLADPNEKLSDYLYRRLVTARMISLIKNPNPKISSNELNLMKNWVTCWINLVSIPTIKDFLSRLSFQLMDTENVKGTDTLA